MPTASSIATVSSLSVSADLIEDYEHSVTPAAGPNVTDRFQAVRRPGPHGPTVDLVSVHNQGGLLRAFADPASASGWTTEQVQVDDAPSEVPTSLRAFAEDNALTVLARYPAAQHDQPLLAMVHTPARGWEPAPFRGDLANALAEMTQTDVLTSAQTSRYASPGGSQVNLVYGVSVYYSPAAFVVVEASTKGWTVPYIATADPNTVYKLLPGQAADDLVLLEFKGTSITVRPGSIRNGQATFADGTTHASGAGALDAESVTPLPSPAPGHTSFAVLTTEGALVRFDLTSDSISYDIMTGDSNLQPASVTSYATGTAPDGAVVIFALDRATGLLWHGDLTSWTCLGDSSLIAVTTPTTTLGEPEAFTFTSSLSIQHLSRSGANHLWNTATVRASTIDPQPARISSHAFEVTALNAEGQVVPMAVLQLSLDRSAVIVIDGTSTPAGPETPVTARTGLDGVVSCTVRAEDLTSPALTVTAAPTFAATSAASGEAGVTETFRADARTHLRLSGADPSLPVTGESLKAAGIIPTSTDGQTATQVATALTSLGQAASHATGDGPAPPAGTVKLKGPASTRAAAVEDWPGGLPLVDDGIFGDIIHFFEQCVETVESIAVTFDEDVIRLEVTIGNEVRRLEAETVDEIGHAMRLILAAVAAVVREIEQAIEQAINWLRMVFSWDDILDTAQVVQYVIVSVLSNIKRDIQTVVPQKLHEFVQMAESDVEAAIDGLVAALDPGTTIGTFGPTTSNNPMLQPGNPILATGLKSSQQSHATRCNYPRRRATTAFDQVAFPAGAADGNMLADFVKAFETNYPTDQLAASWQTVHDTAAHVRSLDDVLDLALVAILEGAKDLILLVLDGVESVIDALLEVLAGAIDALIQLGEQPLDVPVLSWLYHELTGEDLTIFGLLSLVIAAPVTVLYKIFQGTTDPTPPFPDPQNFLNQPIPWWDNPPATAADVDTAAESSWQTVRGVVVLLDFLAYSVFDVLGDLDAASHIIPEDKPTAVETGLSLFVVGLELTAQGFAYPAFDSSTQAGRWEIGSWAAMFLPPVLDTVSVIFSTKRALMKLMYLPTEPVPFPLGPWVVCASGAMLLGVASKTVYEMEHPQIGKSYSDAQKAALLLPTFPLILQPIVILGVKSEPAQIAQVCLWLVDAIGDVGTGVSFLVSVEQGSE